MQKIMIILISGISMSILAQSAWNQQEKQGFTQLSYSSIADYDSLFSEEGSDIQLNSEISESVVNFYGEYGVNDKITLSLNIPYFQASRSSSSVEQDHSGLGNIEIGSRFKLYSGKFELAGTLNLAANTSDFDQRSGIRTGYDAWSLSPFLSIGKSFGKFYAQAHIGANLRTNSFSHSFRLTSELGVKLFNRLVVAAIVDIQKSLKNGDIQLDSNQLATGLFVNNQEFVATGVKASYEIQDTYGINGAILGAASGNFVPKQSSVNLGVYYKF